MLFVMANLAEATSLSKIQSAFNNKELDYETTLVYKYYALFDRSKLPEKYNDKNDLAICGTPLIDEIFQNWEKLSSQTKEILKDTKARPYCTYTYTSPKGYFNIHYNTSGEHAADVDFVHLMAAVFDTIWEFEVDTMGYYRPPPDGSAGGNDNYDIYLQDIFNPPDSYTLGYCAAEYYSDYYPWVSATSYVVMDNDYAGLSNPMDHPYSTGSHEFHHAIQCSYDYQEGTWYKEFSSEWISDVFCKPRDIPFDYGHVDNFFEEPWDQMNQGDTGETLVYGKCVWNFYLHQSTGDADIVRKIWDECRYENATDAFIMVLENDYHTTLGDEFMGFTVWNYMTGTRANESHPHYEDGSIMTAMVRQATYDTYPVISVSPETSVKPEILGSNYLQFNPNEATGNLRLYFYGYDNTTWGLSLVLNQSNQCTSESKFVGDTRKTYFDVPNFEDYSAVILIPAVIQPNGISPCKYRYSAFTSLPLDFTGYGITNAKGNKVAPNEPVNMTIKLANLLQDFTIPAVNAILHSDDPTISITDSIISIGNIGMLGTYEDTTDYFTWSVDDDISRNLEFDIICSDSSGFSVTYEIYIPLIVNDFDILIVDDDADTDNTNSDYENLYLAFLANKEVSYIYWDNASLDIPSNDIIDKASAVIWFTGDDSTNTLTSDEQNVITHYLDNAGNLAIMGQYLGYDLYENGDANDQSFYQNYLHSTFATNPSTSHWLNGVASDPIGDGYSYLQLDARRTGELTTTSADPVFEWAYEHEGIAGLRYSGGSHKLVYYAFGMENLMDESPRNEILDKTANWLGVTVGIEDNTEENPILPKELSLSQNYPNPFNPQTTITYNLPTNTNICLSIYNVNGQLVRTLTNTKQNAGTYSIEWNGKDNNNNILSSGLYFYRLDTDNESITRKMLLLK